MSKKEFDAMKTLYSLIDYHEGEYSVLGRQCIELRCVFKVLSDFASNVAKPMSEPLNSAVGSRNKEQRRYWMGQLRESARAALARVGGAQS
jgi:hypothetical protein